MLDPTI
jgi:hypothetical protein